MSEKRATAIIGVGRGRRCGRANTAITALAWLGLVNIMSIRWIVCAQAACA